MTISILGQGRADGLMIKGTGRSRHYRNGRKARPHGVALAGASADGAGSPLIGAVAVLTSDRTQGLVTRCKAIAVFCAVRTHRAMTMLALLRASRTVIWNRQSMIRKSGHRFSESHAQTRR